MSKLFSTVALFLFVLLAAKPSFAAGTCPSGNTTIDPSGNPINIANIGVNGTITGGITGCFYASQATGSDTNTGTDEAHPWKHIPGMSGCTGTCASTTPSGGEAFILKGGDTWTAPTDMNGLQWLWSGTSSHPIAVSTDPAWFNSTACGGSWCRPIFNGNSAMTQNMFNIGNLNWNIFDNIESTGMTSTVNGCQMVNSTNTRCTQLYFHGWSHGAGGNSAGFFAQCGTADMVDHNVVDGSDSTKNTGNGVYAGCAGTIQYNYFSYLVSGVLANVDLFRFNTILNSVQSVDGDHCNGMFVFGPVSSNGPTVDDNVVGNMICSGGVNFWLNGLSNGSSSWVTNAWNNIILASAASGNIFNIGGHPTQGNTGTYNIYNTTVVALNVGACVGNGESAPRSTTNYANMHCIGTTQICQSTGTTCNNGGGNIQQSVAEANSQGYTATETLVYSPVSSSGASVAAGTNVTSACTGQVANPCNAITYPNYDIKTHTTGVTTASPAGNPRGTTWQIGAYQFANSVTPQPPTNVTATVH
jgi:hypothetical protein